MRIRFLSRINKGLILFLLLIGGIGVGAYGKVTEEPRREDGCLQSGPEGNVVALVDGSDPIPDTQLSELGRWLRNLAIDSGSNKKLWIFVFGGGVETDLIPISAGCNAAGDAGWMTGQIWLEKTLAAFTREMEQMLAGLEESVRGQSPIIEGSDRLLFKAELFENGGADLYLFSDLVQNTAMWSQFPGSSAYRSPSSGKFPKRAGLPSRKWNSVRLFEIQRPQWRRLQTEESGRWWVELFAPISTAVPVLEKL